MSTLSAFLRRSATPVAAVVASLALSSCGGGDPYTGLWEGSQNGNQPVKVIMLGDGTYYMKYGGAGRSQFDWGGLIRGSGEFRGATFKSDDGVDFKFVYPPQAPAGARISAKLRGHQTVSGHVNETPLKLTYVKPFDPHGVLADLAGSYPGEVIFAGGLRRTTFAVMADGRLSTKLNDCNITGQVVPRSDDAFDLTIQFGASPCVFPGAVFKGAAIYSQDLQKLEAAVVSDIHQQAITFEASRGN